MMTAMTTLMTIELTSDDLLWLPSLRTPKCLNCMSGGAGLSLRSGFAIKILQKCLPHLEAEDGSRFSEDAKNGATEVQQSDHSCEERLSSGRTLPVCPINVFRRRKHTRSP
jgi:hypothetical protein